MHERTAQWTGLVNLEAELEREFEARLSESSTLAFRVAFSVLQGVNTVLLKDGQTRQYTVATDRVTGEGLKVDVTLRVLKQ